MDLNKGGSKGKKLVTAYREASILIATSLQQYGPLSTKELRELGSDNKKTTSILNQNYYGWFERVKKGVYKLTEKGLEDLQQYPELVEYYKAQINSKIAKADKIGDN